jgi:serine O-acetyltransferase
MNKNNPVSFNELVQSIVASYSAEPRTCHINAGYLPNRDVIISVIHELQELLFPGYFGRQNLRSSILEYHVGDLLMSIQEKLAKQIRHVLHPLPLFSAYTSSELERHAEQLMLCFLRTIPQLRQRLATDVQAAFEGDPAASSPDEIIFSYPGLFAITVHRIAHVLYMLKVPLIPRIMAEYAHNQTGIDIHPGATIGDYFFIDHGTGVVIGETVEIGEHVKIYQGVTLGALSTRGGQSLRGAKRHPTIENEVTVYSGASILGGDTVVGKGVVISSNVFITKSVPPRTRVTVKNPELQYRDQTPLEFKQDLPIDWVI